MDDQELQTLRGKIDEIDDQLIACLAERMQLALEVAARKLEIDCPIVQQNRAIEVENHYIHMGKALGLDSQFMADIFHKIHNESCRMQARLWQI